MTFRSSVNSFILFAVGVSLLLSGCGSDDDDDATAHADGAGRGAQTTAPTFMPVTDQMLAASHTAAEGWLTHGGAYTNQRYSSLDQINRENVHRLVPVWIHQTGLAETFTTTPIIVGNLMYLTTAESQVIALDARTGERIWDFTPNLRTTRLCCGPQNRGVAVYGDKVYVATLDARVIALNNRTGEVVWETEIADPDDGYSQSMAPLAYNGKVVVGVGGTEFGIRGFVTALDAQSGEEVWRWYTIPEPDGQGNGWWGEWRETDPFGAPLQRDIAHEQRLVDRYQDNWRRGGGAVETTPAYDPSTQTLYLVVGNPAPALDGVIRPGDNLYSGSIVALNAEQGTLRWYMQYLPHDVWDLSGGSPPLLIDSEGRRLVVHASKTGWVYFLDAASGQPLMRSDNFVPQEGLFTRPTEEGVRMAPGANGGADGSPVSYSPRTGLAYVTGLHQPMVYRRSFQPRETGRIWIGGSFRFIPEEAQWANLSAIDIATGEIRWQRQLPALTSGGTLVTAGDILFVGQGNGAFDAFDATTGEVLWSFQTGAGVNGSPVTYMIDGVQYVAVASGGNSQIDTPRGNALIVFTLDSNRGVPARTAYPAPSYARGGPILFNAVRQVPATEVDPAATPGGQP